MTAIALPVLLAGGGVAVDVSNMVLTRSQIQTATDAAALATASALTAGKIDTTTATQFAKDFVSGEMANFLSSNATALAALKASTTVAVTQAANGATGKIFTVAVSSTYSMTTSGMTRILGWNNVNIGATSSTSSATESKNALSMYLVLDRSGSMDEDTDTVNATTPTTCTKYKNNGECKTLVPNYYTKMESLKIAVSDLTAQLDKADPNSLYVRTGGDSYNSTAQAQSALTWGTNDIGNYVDDLTASGTTNSAGAFTNGYNALMATTEDQAHKDKNGQIPTKYIIFMTDGENNVANADSTTRTYCDKARTAKIQVYTVALMAPTAGQNLLNYCATSSATYFKAENSDDLVAAFKAIGEQASAQLTLMTK